MANFTLVLFMDGDVGGMRLGIRIGRFSCGMSGGLVAEI